MKWTQVFFVINKRGKCKSVVSSHLWPLDDLSLGSDFSFNRFIIQVFSG